FIRAPKRTKVLARPYFHPLSIWPLRSKEFQKYNNFFQFKHGLIFKMLPTNPLILERQKNIAKDKWVQVKFNSSPTAKVLSCQSSLQVFKYSSEDCPFCYTYLGEKRRESHDHIFSAC